MVIALEQLPHMSADELRDVVQSLLKTVTFKQATIDKLTHENAYLKRLKFAAQSERFSAEQRSLLEETLDEDLQAVNDEIEELSATDAPTPRVKAQLRGAVAAFGGCAQSRHPEAQCGACR